MGCLYSRFRNEQSTESTWEGESETASMGPMEVKTLKVQKENRPPMYRTTINSPVPVKIAIQPRRHSVEVRQERPPVKDVETASRGGSCRRISHPYPHLNSVLRSKTIAEKLQEGSRSMDQGDGEYERICFGWRNKLKEGQHLSRSSPIPVPQPRKAKNLISTSEPSSENEDVLEFGDDHSVHRKDSSATEF